MSHCPITLEPLGDDESISRKGLRSLHPQLKRLLPLPLSGEEQLREARLRADKMSIQGVQPKLSAVLRVKDARFEIVDGNGRFILKPNPTPFEEVPANEALTMSLAAMVGIEVPDHGLLPALDGSWVYFIRRFDRAGRDMRLHQEDFAQLTGAGRETKYQSSLEQVAKVVETHCTFPVMEKAKLVRLLLFCFLTGNEDMHLKNFSLVVKDGVVRLAPGYDLLNTTLVLENATEESALPLRGKKRKLTRNDWADYFCCEKMALPKAVVHEILSHLQDGLGRWPEMVRRSKLSAARQRGYLAIVRERQKRLFGA